MDEDNQSQTSSLISSASNGELRRRAVALPKEEEKCTTVCATVQRIQQDCAATSGTPTIHKVEGLDDMSTHGAPEDWMEKHTQNIKDALTTKSFDDWISMLLPMYSWLKVYKWRDCLLTDILAGMTVGVMIIPQSMSYAKLAGLPVEFGLYSSLIPIYAYALFGSSRQLAVGPVALVSLLLNTGLSLVLDGKGITSENTENYDEIYAVMAIQTSFLVGICYIIMGVLRLGFLTIFLSHTVVSGFTSAAAIIIGLSQVKYIFGYSLPSDKELHNMLKNIFANIGKFNWKTFLLGMSCVFFLLGCKTIAKKFSKHPVLKWARAAAPLLITVITIVLQLAIDLEKHGIPIVKEIPPGLPKFSGAEAIAIENIGELAVVVLSIVIVGFMESIAISKQLAAKNNYEIDSSKELIGLGMANTMAGLFFGFPLTGSFSRSAVNNEAGAKSGISSVVTATLVGLTLLFLTPVFELLSLPTLAAIVISGVVSLVDYDEAIYLWKVHRFDFGVWMFAFLGTLFLGVELGLGLAVGISLLLVIFESAYPHTAILGRLPGTTEYRNIKNYSQAEKYDGIIVVRIDAPIYFANTQQVRDKLNKYETRETQRLSQNQMGGPQQVHYIIVELNAVAHIDTSALHILSEMHKSYISRNVQMCFTNPNAKVMSRLETSGLIAEIGRKHIFVSTHDAVNYCLNTIHLTEESKHEENAGFPVVLHVPSGETNDKEPLNNNDSELMGDVETQFAKERRS